MNCWTKILYFVIKKGYSFTMEVSVQNQFQGQYLIGASKDKGKFLI